MPNFLLKMESSKRIHNSLHGALAFFMDVYGKVRYNIASHSLSAGISKGERNRSHQWFGWHSPTALLQQIERGNLSHWGWSNVYFSSDIVELTWS